MSTDNNNNGSESKQPLRLSKPGKLELRKTVDAGQVKQSFSHGRSKTVVVEKRTKRTFERGATGKMAAVPNQELAEGLASLKKSGPSSDQDRANAARREQERKSREAAERARQDELRQLAEAEEARRQAERAAKEADAAPKAAEPSSDAQSKEALADASVEPVADKVRT